MAGAAPHFQAEEIVRTDERWTVDFPTYRVTFWSLPETAGLAGPYSFAFNAEHWRLTGAIDVHAALNWAARDGRSYELFAEVETDDHELALLRIAGFNPTRGEEEDPINYLSDPTGVTCMRTQIAKSRRMS